MTDKIAFSSVRPRHSLDLLSQREMTSLVEVNPEVYALFRLCALAVLNTGVNVDDTREVSARYDDFRLQVVPEPRGLKLELHNAPAQAFVDGRMIEGISAHLFSALRDIVYTHHKLAQVGQFDLESRSGITDAVFRVLRNANIVRSDTSPRLVVCWGGHSISRQEYDFSKEVGYEFGLRGMDIATGCGPGAMKGPMKGAAIGHAKQLNHGCRYVGISEPGIIVAESPNAMVNELVILPDIEKRLEAFVRLAHGIVIFPGGVGTAEEIMYLLGVKMHPANADIPLPLIMAAPKGSEAWFERIDRFLRHALGEEVSRHYDIIIGDPAGVAQRMKQGLRDVRDYRVRTSESFGFNWGLHIENALQQPFIPSHERMAALHLDRSRPQHELIADLRRVFSGLVAGNVKEQGIRQVEEHGPYQLNGEADVIALLGELLAGFVAEGRMKINPDNYVPCFSLAC
ncbi:nucleotide 5'-monophosphate nucleosidase PpnN [Haliea sp. E17]|uniref:nucleotide 5'-monophosphate nucleosidase PpnN n=1 Tax=Haliea sp. E17 TaxID=3401576 RepID=UPI003AB0CD03